MPCRIECLLRGQLHLRERGDQSGVLGPRAGWPVTYDSRRSSRSGNRRALQGAVRRGCVISSRCDSCAPVPQPYRTISFMVGSVLTLTMLVTNFGVALRVGSSVCALHERRTR